MGIQLISISHKLAPVSVRELFAFSMEQQLNIMRKMRVEGFVDECIILSTCNRTEVYTYSSLENERDVFLKLKEVLLFEAGALENENMGDYIRFYNDKKAIHHLFQVTAGLDSMVIGEDQILGQVKRAQEAAMDHKTSGVYLNTFFRYAITGSKKVKTDTELSKTSVSTASLAIKVAEDMLGGLKDKKVMIIGASGKIGSIVLKNLKSIQGAKTYITTRQETGLCENYNQDYHMIKYETRYEYMDQMDVVISATTSPHYTLTYNKVKKSIDNTEKQRIFIDLAVPMDIEDKIGTLKQCSYFNIDDFSLLALANNKKKMEEAKAADSILLDYELQFERWMLFQKSIPLMQEIKHKILLEAEEKGAKRAIDHFFYRVRENNQPDELYTFFDCIKNIRDTI